MLYFQGVSPVLCSSIMYFPLFLPLRAEIRETLYLNAKLLFRRVISSRRLRAKYTPCTKLPWVQGGISLLCMVYCPKGSASKTGSDSYRNRADSRRYEKNLLTDTADRRRKTAAMGLPIYGGVHISGLKAKLLKIG